MPDFSMPVLSDDAPVVYRLSKAPVGRKCAVLADAQRGGFDEVAGPAFSSGGLPSELTPAQHTLPVDG